MMTWGTMVLRLQDLHTYLSHVCSKQGCPQENKDAAIEDDSLQGSWLKIPDGSHQNATVPRILLYSLHSRPFI